MATRSHSRFTDDIYCTPVPTAPSIQVKTIDILRNEIFFSNLYEEYQQGLHAAEELNSKDLYENYPPNFENKNKLFIFDLLNNKHTYLPSPNKSILFTRWKPFIPIIESNNRSSTVIKFQADVFNYKSDSNSQTIEWYLNFANSDLFAYYGGPLLAQDELQVLECVELAALRQYFIQAINTVGSRTVNSDAHNNRSVPTPILISNTERVIELDTKDIYGNSFAHANKEQLQHAFKLVEPPQVVNLIAIEAPSYGEGCYTYDQINYILTNCYTGFKAAQILAHKTHEMNTYASKSHDRRPSRSEPNIFRTVIHTGWWGCGAYGNNRQMMLITQMLAAHWAHADEIIFHTQNNEHENDITKARAVFEQLKNGQQVREIIEEIIKLNLEWEKSNNT
ncbi:unnamed protein product [Rotaria sp. Silwood1]|nr:unnamed protein product [Rotaria sp. Silwood1]CAF1075100.1 unnamed protein product [Rotaria sp. Silwood1]CAF3411089.1 unnamed protein product [Rotaria sp. Silwood1]CAF4935885.1 unnamed protein product [Rotaria sp. Silwood1]